MPEVVDSDAAGDSGDCLRDAVVAVDDAVRVAMAFRADKNEFRNDRPRSPLHQDGAKRCANRNECILVRLLDGYADEALFQVDQRPPQISHVAATEAGMQGDDEPILRLTKSREVDLCGIAAGLEGRAVTPGCRIPLADLLRPVDAMLREIGHESGFIIERGEVCCPLVVAQLVVKSGLTKEQLLE
ncbi:MAG TPA: hypothetical protein VI670_09970 [Thermoanaerobaculia bacterium]